MVASFWVTTMVWDLLIYLVTGNGVCPKNSLGSRMSYRRLTRHQRVHRSPLLRFLPMAWMILSNTVRTPHDWYQGVGNLTTMSLPTQELSGQLIQQFSDVTFQRVQDIDEKVVLNVETLAQYNQSKFEALWDGMLEKKMILPKPTVPEVTKVKTQKKDNVGEFFDAYHEELSTPSQVDCHFDTDESQYFFDSISDDQPLYDLFDIQGICLKRTTVDCVSDEMSCADHLSKMLEQQKETSDSHATASINGQ
jgi:hypothetical protein